MYTLVTLTYQEILFLFFQEINEDSQTKDVTFNFSDFRERRRFISTISAYQYVIVSIVLKQPGIFVFCPEN